MVFLKIEDLCKVYGKNENKVIVFDYVLFIIEKGEFIVIIGFFGFGKFILLYFIVGVDVLISGKIYLEG